MASLKRNEGESWDSYVKRRAARHEAFKIMNRGELIETPYYDRKERRSKAFKAKLAAHKKELASSEENAEK